MTHLVIRAILGQIYLFQKGRKTLMKGLTIGINLNLFQNTILLLMVLNTEYCLLPKK